MLHIESKCIAWLGSREFANILRAPAKTNLRRNDCAMKMFDPTEKEGGINVTGQNWRSTSYCQQHASTCYSWSTESSSVS